MAAPADKTLKNLSGRWVMNKNLSDNIDKILQLQNIGWLLRQAIQLATITLTIKQYTDSDSKTHIDISQRATGGIQGTTEQRVLDWAWRDHKDAIFGSVRGKSRWCKLSEVDDDEWMVQGWEEPGGDFVQSYVESKDAGWTADQVWGFEVVDGKRYHTRHVNVRKGDDWKMVRLVYDWQGAITDAKEAEENDGLAYGE